MKNIPDIYIDIHVSVVDNIWDIGYTYSTIQYLQDILHIQHIRIITPDIDIFAIYKDIYSAYSYIPIVHTDIFLHTPCIQLRHIAIAILRHPLHHIYTHLYSGVIVLGHFSFSDTTLHSLDIEDISQYIHIHSTPEKPIYVLPLSPNTGIFLSIFAKYLLTSPNINNQEYIQNIHSSKLSETKNTKYSLSASPNIHLLRQPSPNSIEIIPYAYTRMDLADMLLPYIHIDTDIAEYQHIVVIFDYSDTYTPDFRYIIAENTVVFGFSEHIPLYLPESSIYVQLSMLPIHIFQYMLYNCDICIVRGETSIQYVLSLGVPFLWDMYKSLGWWDTDEYGAFKTYMKNVYTEDMYRDLDILNTKKWDIYLEKYLDKDVKKKFRNASIEPKIPHIWKYIEKCIDTFDFSI